MGRCFSCLSSMPSSSPPAKPLTLMLTDGRGGLRQHLACDAVWADGTQQPSGGLPGSLSRLTMSTDAVVRTDLFGKVFLKNRFSSGCSDGSMNIMQLV